MNKKELLTQDILDNYHLYPAKYFTEKYSCSLSWVSSIACKLKVTHNQTWERQREDIIKDYLDNHTLDYLGDKYGHYEQNVRKKLISWGVKIRENGELNTKYTLIKDYFRNIDSHEKAYWLGFIYADGNVYLKEGFPTFQICLGNKDRKHLIKLKNSIGSNHPIYEDRGNPRLMICCKEFVKNLINLNVDVRKSLTLEFPSETILSKEFENSFILGYYDGDGYISYRENGKYKQWFFGIIALKPFLEKIQEILFKEGIKKTKLTQEKRKADGLLYYMNYGGNVEIKNKKLIGHNLIKFYNYIYKDSPVWLDRKKERIELILNERYGNNWRTIEI